MIKFKWDDLTDNEKSNFGNGFGPSWLPKIIRDQLTIITNTYFDDADWRHHDFGYYKGKTEIDRIHYDWLFFLAMIKDSMNTNYRIMLSLFSLMVFIIVRLLGWISFHYDKEFRGYNGKN